jgi:predicted ribosomally synthesized peptide with nif11-like leader
MNIEDGLAELKKHPDLLKSLAGARTQEEWVQKTRKTLDTLGYTFSTEQIEEYLSNRELSDEELEAVAGGMVTTFFIPSESDDQFFKK